MKYISIEKANKVIDSIFAEAKRTKDEFQTTTFFLSGVFLFIKILKSKEITIIDINSYIKQQLILDLIIYYTLTMSLGMFVSSIFSFAYIVKVKDRMRRTNYETFTNRIIIVIFSIIFFILYLLK